MTNSILRFRNTLKVVVRAAPRHRWRTTDSGAGALRLSDYLGRAMKDEPTRPGSTSSPALRKQFLKALDADDYSALRRMCSDLRACTEILPSTVCASLGLPRGSTYAKAAETIVAA